MKITRWGVLAVFILAGCGSSGTGTSTGGSGTSTNATRGATSAALGAGSASAGAGATSQSLVVQALRTQMKGATFNVPETTLEPITFPCASGSGTSDVVIEGSVVI